MVRVVREPMHFCVAAEESPLVDASTVLGCTSSVKGTESKRHLVRWKSDVCEQVLEI